jgi:hypothetical protein
MSRTVHDRRRTLAAFAMLLLAFAGCSSGPAVAPVTGVVLVNGKPAAKVAVEFHPDATKGTSGPSSRGETDKDGRFTLTFATRDRSGDGAVVGWHKVVLSDLRLAESETGHGVPVRFGSEYGSVITTPLSYEVNPTPQTVTLEVPPRVGAE